MNNYFKDIKSISYEFIINPFASCRYLSYITSFPPNGPSACFWSHIYSVNIYKNFKCLNDGINLSKFVFIVH